MTEYAQQLDALIDGTLDAKTFAHVDHVGVAFEALIRNSYFDALQIVASGIDRAATKVGATDKFNATITAAFMSLIAERMDTGSYSTAQEFIDQNPDLISGAPLRTLYSSARLSSDQARRVALLPDIARSA